jgi:protein-S-isoprenylcysteine O-methyltransferase Ste14
MTHQVSNLVDDLALIYLILFFPAPFFWLIIHPAIRFWRRVGMRTFWVALPLYTIFAALLLDERRLIFSHRLGRNVLTDGAGAALAIFGLWLGHRMQRQFGLRRLVGVPEVNSASDAAGLVQDGLFAVVRHPRYISYMATILGFALLTGALGIFALAFATILLYLIVAPLEERELSEHYGAEYQQYARRVPRFCPRIRRNPRPH